MSTGNGGSVPYLGAARIGSLMRAHGITPRRSLGQNFVIDPNTIRKVIDVAGIGSNDHVLEIGAGCGSLTVGLASCARRVTALEVDERLLPPLTEVVDDTSNVDVVHGDALTVSLGSFGATKLVANLPYNIAATVVLRALEIAPEIDVFTVMTQKEVGLRLAAPPGSKIYGQTSVMVAFFGTARVAGRISRRAFYPVPRVDSVIVSITRHERQPDIDRPQLFEIVKASFSQRRKTMRNSLASVAGSTAEAEDALRTARVAPTARAEDLDLEQFIAIAEALR
ncbi:MAG: 16S rRNA (adenine(1518)-N(6)/adenine(1519)-N(6))-dimethyltransferase RsmA [Actinomycetota bacterium]